MEEKNLTYLRTLTPEQFKAEMHVEHLYVKENPKPEEGKGKYFFTYGASVGAVSKKGIPTKSPMISYVQGTPSDRNPDGKFWILHEEAQGGAPIVATF